MNWKLIALGACSLLLCIFMTSADNAGLAVSMGELSEYVPCEIIPTLYSVVETPPTVYSVVAH